MRWTWLFLSLLFVSTGCRHGGSPLPTLPASHGHLSLAMERYLSAPMTSQGALWSTMWDALSKEEPAPSLGAPKLELEPEQASAVFAEAVQVLRGSPDEAALHRAAIDIRAACEAGLHDACQYARDTFIAAELISREAIPYPLEMLKRRRFGFMSFRCRIDTEGRVRDCKTIEEIGRASCRERVL